MQTKIVRLCFVLAFLLSALGVSTTVALADKPTTYEVGPITGGAVLTDVCSFPVTLSSTFSIAGIDFVHMNGVVTKSHWHFTSQDTLTANGKTLVGIPYTYNADVYWDSAGNATGMYVNGVFENIPLPDKGHFKPAGRVDLTDNPLGFTLTPDHGNPGDIAGLCAALAP